MSSVRTLTWTGKGIEGLPMVLQSTRQCRQFSLVRVLERMFRHCGQQVGQSGPPRLSREKEVIRARAHETYDSSRHRCVAGTLIRMVAE